MSKRDELAAVLGEHRVNYHHRNVGGETAATLRFTSCDGCDWLGGWHDEAGWERHLADAVLAWLGEQFDDGLREAVATEVAIAFGGWRGPDKDGYGDDWSSEADAALAVVRERLGLSDAPQDAQDGLGGAGSGGAGFGSSESANGAQIQDFEGDE